MTHYALILTSETFLSVFLQRGNLQDICFLVMAQFILDETFVLLTRLLDYNIVIIIITRD